MGPPPAHIRRLGDRVDLDWPGLAECTELSAWCRLRDGTVRRSSGWTPVPEDGDAERLRTTCGPLLVELALRSADGCLRMRLEAQARAEVEVVEIALAMRPRLVASSLGWVL